MYMSESISQPSTSHGQSSTSTNLFVGCLDPMTAKDEVWRYFQIFDGKVKVKLIVDFKTGKSKQCRKII